MFAICGRTGASDGEYTLHMDMTHAFHAGSTGSNPVRGTTCNTQDSEVPNTPPRDHASPTLRARSIITLLLTGTIATLTLTLALAYTPPALPSSSDAFNPTASHPTPARTITSHRWIRAGISHYGEGDGLMYHRTACGRIVTPNANYAAALTPDLAHCGQRITIRYKGRTIHTTIQDRGAYRTDGRHLDAAPGLRRRLGFTGVAVIHYHKGWS